MKIDDVKKKVEIIELYDEYSLLLTDKQRRYFELYYFDDLSLSEISEIEKISRNAAYDQINRTVKKLADIDSKLHNVKYKKITRLLINELKEKEYSSDLIKELEDME